MKLTKPSNIHGLALNYPGVGGLGDTTPLYFVKSQLAYCESGAEVKLPADTTRTWTEVELGVVIKETLEMNAVISFENHIEGFIIGADISCDNICDRDHHLGFSKSRRNFCPVSTEVIKLGADIVSNLEMCTIINGNVTQTGNTKNMMLCALKAVEYINNLVGLEKGDIILTGTPSGHENNTLKVGDEVIHTIEKLGELRFTIV